MSEHAMTILPGSTRKAMPNARLVAKSDPAQRIQVSIYVRRNPNPPAAAVNALQAFETQLPAQRRKISDDEFNALYGADPADLQKVASWAEANNFKVLDSSVPKCRVKVEGAIADVQKAFQLQLNEYEHPENGHFRGREGDVHIPAELTGVITGVFGLDTRRVGRSRRRVIAGRSVAWETLKAAPHKKGDTHLELAKLSNQWPGTFFPPQVAQLYHYPTPADGTGQNVAIFAFNGPPSPDPRGGYKLASLQTYFQQVLGGKTPSITDVVVQVPATIPAPTAPPPTSAAIPPAR